MRPGQQLSDLTADLVRGLGGALAALEPDWSIVQGDTTTAFCGALASFYENIPVAHVEAGLRSGCERTPFPEEANRQLVARVATLHFSPTARSADNLLAEGVARDRVLVTRNTASTHCSGPSGVLAAWLHRSGTGDDAGFPHDAQAEKPRRGSPQRLPSRPPPRAPRRRGDRLPGAPQPGCARRRCAELSRVDGVQLSDPLDYLALVRHSMPATSSLRTRGPRKRACTRKPSSSYATRRSDRRRSTLVSRLVGTDPAVIVDAAADSSTIQPRTQQWHEWRAPSETAARAPHCQCPRGVARRRRAA
jgi:UDP-N-acetylglucosamine 2-epimerase (non-hydrolysing)